MFCLQVKRVPEAGYIRQAHCCVRRCAQWASRAGFGINRLYTCYIISIRSFIFSFLAGKLTSPFVCFNLVLFPVVFVNSAYFCIYWAVLVDVCKSRYNDLDHSVNLDSGSPGLLEMVFANRTILPAYRRVVDLGHELDLRILKRIVVKFEVDYVLGSLVGGIYWAIEGEIPVKEIVVDKLDLDSRDWSFV